MGTLFPGWEEREGEPCGIKGESHPGHFPLPGLGTRESARAIRARNDTLLAPRADATAGAARESETPLQGA